MRKIYSNGEGGGEEVLADTTTITAAATGWDFKVVQYAIIRGLAIEMECKGVLQYMQGHCGC